MTAHKKGPTGGTHFDITIGDGRSVRLCKQTWYGHILPRHPELSQYFGNPFRHIETALLSPVATGAGNKPHRVLFIGPTEWTPAVGCPCCLHVIVEFDSETTGWVVTAFPKL
jgi:hypothetical protein